MKTKKIKSFWGIEYIMNVTKVEKNWWADDVEKLLASGEYNPDLIQFISAPLGLVRADFDTIADWAEALVDELEKLGFISEVKK